MFRSSPDSSTRVPPPLPSQKYRDSQQRQAMCTHSVMTRLYNIDSKYRCQIPGCRRNDRWLYHCVQDHHGYLPNLKTKVLQLSDFVVKIPLNEDGDIQLNKWVGLAIEDGHYTPEQISALIDQRDGVKWTLLDMAERAPTPSTASDFTTSSMEDNNTTLTSIAPATVAEELARCFKIDSSQAAFSSDHECRDVSLNDTSFFSSALQSPHLELTVPVCTFKCCHGCRPAYRDRSYISLNSFLNTPCTAPPQWDLDNRPVSDANVVKRIGLPKSRKTDEEMGREAGNMFEPKREAEQKEWNAIARRGSDHGGSDRIQSIFKRLKVGPRSDRRVSYLEDNDSSPQSLPLTRKLTKRCLRSSSDRNSIELGESSKSVSLPRNVSSTLVPKRWSTLKMEEETSPLCTNSSHKSSVPMVLHETTSPGKENELDGEGRMPDTGVKNEEKGKGATRISIADIISQV